MKKSKATPNKGSQAQTTKAKDGCHGCPGCGVGLGDDHLGTCKKAICWTCGVNHPQDAKSYSHGPFPWTGDLEPVFSGHNQYHLLMDGEALDHMPRYQEGKLIGLTSNGIDVGVWRAIMESPQAKDLIDFTFPMPHLNLQRPEDAALALLGSTWRTQLRVVQFGIMDRYWGAADNQEEWSSEGEDTAALVHLIECMPTLNELYLNVYFPKFKPILTANFPRKMTVLRIKTWGSVDLGLLAENRSLSGLESLSIVLSNDPSDRPDKAFHDSFRRLVNSPSLKKLQELSIEVPQLDDQCCDTIVASKALKNLSRLRLAGQITVAGAEALAVAKSIKALEELQLEGGGISDQDRQVLRAAGVKLVD